MSRGEGWREGGTNHNQQRRKIQRPKQVSPPRPFRARHRQRARLHVEPDRRADEEAERHDLRRQSRQHQVAAQIHLLRVVAVGCARHDARPDPLQHEGEDVAGDEDVCDEAGGHAQRFGAPSARED